MHVANSSTPMGCPRGGSPHEFQDWRPEELRSDLFYRDAAYVEESCFACL